MVKAVDAQRLKSQQYHTSDNLSARIRLHEQYSTAKKDFHHWVFDALLKQAPANAHILELGCGRGDMWKKNANRIPAEWHVTLTDFSAGMLDDCKNYLNIARCSRFAYDIVDAQDIPFSADRFDVVIANHMLYHVPDRPAALAEIRRVLKPDGVLLATTIGQNHMCELMELAEKFIPLLAEERDDYGFILGNFSLENGSKQLKSAFKSVRTRRFSDGLHVTDTQPLMDYIGSMIQVPGEALMQKNSKKLQTEIKKRIKANGAINITKDSGLFIATGG